MRAATAQAARGFTILELLIATAIFLVITAAMFGLLQLSQQKYTGETQLSGAFQETRLAIDQIVRDFNVSGFPSQSVFSTLPTDTTKYALSPVAWSPNYLAGTPCVLAAPPLGAPCTTPGDFDLILETDLGNGNGVSWIRYQLIATTLFRSVVPKTAGTDPAAPPLDPTVVVPFLTNVMNSSAQPIFKFTCDTPAGPQPCPAAGSNGVPNRIRDVDITLIVKTRQPDPQTGRLKLVELAGRGHRVNPSN
jgi:prepilin-type N-terminal cleavage/methylation domain-containing protein